MMETVGELNEIRIFQMNEGYFLDKPILGDSKKKNTLNLSTACKIGQEF